MHTLPSAYVISNMRYYIHVCHWGFAATRKGKFYSSCLPFSTEQCCDIFLKVTANEILGLIVLIQVRRLHLHVPL